MSEDLTPPPEQPQHTLPRGVEPITLERPCTGTVRWALPPALCRSTEGYLDTRTGKRFCSRCGAGVPA